MSYSLSSWGNKSSALTRPNFTIEDKPKENNGPIQKNYPTANHCTEERLTANSEKGDKHLQEKTWTALVAKCIQLLFPLFHFIFLCSSKYLWWHDNTIMPTQNKMRLSSPTTLAQPSLPIAKRQVCQAAQRISHEKVSNKWIKFSVTSTGLYCWLAKNKIRISHWRYSIIKLSLSYTGIFRSIFVILCSGVNQELKCKTRLCARIHMGVLSQATRLRKLNRKLNIITSPLTKLCLESDVSTSLKRGDYFHDPLQNKS